MLEMYLASAKERFYQELSGSHMIAIDWNHKKFPAEKREL